MYVTLLIVLMFSRVARVGKQLRFVVLSVVVTNIQTTEERTLDHHVAAVPSSAAGVAKSNI